MAALAVADVVDVVLDLEDQPQLLQMLHDGLARFRAVEAGKRYRYAVSAVDQSGNESARSAPVEVMAQ